MITKTNLFLLPEVLSRSDETSETIFRNKSIRIERIISTGQTSAWYDQDEDEFVTLLQGAAELEYEDGDRQRLNAGDALMIPAYRKHRVSYTTAAPPCIWLCVFSKNRQSGLFEGG